MKFLPFLIFLTLNTAAQSYDSSFLNSYYEQKTTQFRSLPDEKREIIFLGNSITDIGEWAEIWGNPKVKNRGISSDHTFGVLARLDEVLSSRPAKIFLMIGINDVARNFPDSVILANYRRIVRTIRSTSPKTKLYIQSILPTNNAFTEYKNYQNKLDHVRYLNGELKALASASGSTFVDLFTEFVDSEGKLDRRYTNDGLHLTGAGYQHWKAILKRLGHMK